MIWLRIIARTPFDEIVIAQEALSAAQLAALESFTVSHRIALRRFWLGVTDVSVAAITDPQLTADRARSNSCDRCRYNCGIVESSNAANSTGGSPGGWPLDQGAFTFVMVNLGWAFFCMDRPTARCS